MPLSEDGQTYTFDVCEDCGAAVGEPCLDPDGSPGNPHPARMQTMFRSVLNPASTPTQGSDDG